MGPTATLSLGKSTSGRKDLHHKYTLAAIQPYNSPHPLSESEAASLGPSQAPCDDTARGPPAHTCPKPFVQERRDDSQRALSCPLTSGIRIGRMGCVGKHLVAQTAPFDDQ
ncbi:hypothetical protein Ancab_008749 [Ancistrocladus abbreviatus]